MTHIDDWLDVPAVDEAERVAKEFLEHARRPAVEKDYDWLANHVLTCTYKSRRYRCTGASRLGDVWLARDKKRVHGYDLRIDIADCSDWKMTVTAGTTT